MHRCLEIEEILRLIFEIVSENNSEYSERKGSLAALAITCRLFSAIALDLLWSTMPSLAPLVMSLPTHFWKESELSAVPLTLVSQSRLSKYCTADLLIVSDTSFGK
jgi:hypothetical protein